MIRRIWGLTLRHLYLLRRSPTRWMALLFWPVMSLLVWGFVTMYLKQVVLPRLVLYLLGAVILWDLLYRSQLAVTIAISEEYWVRNIINIFVAPVRTWELVLAACLVGVIKAAISTSVLWALSLFLYSFNLLEVGPILFLYLMSLLVFGWSLGLMTMGLIFRFGQAAEALIWGVPFLLQPISAVFYPVDVLPGWLQALARALPSTYIFEGLRLNLSAGQSDWTGLWISFLLDLVYLAAGGLTFGLILRHVRQKGLLTRQNLE